MNDLSSIFDLFLCPCKSVHFKDILLVMRTEWMKRGAIMSGVNEEK